MRDVVDEIPQGMAAFAERHDREAEQDGEQQHLQDVALGEGAHDAVRDDVQHEFDRMHLAGLPGELGRGGGIRHLAGEIGARAGDVGDEQADDQREGGDDLEIHQRLDADPADLLGVLDVRDARHHGAEDDRRDEHLDQFDEAVAQRLDPFVGRDMGSQPAEQPAEHDGAEHLNIEQLVERLAAGRRRGGNLGHGRVAPGKDADIWPDMRLCR